MPPPSTGRPKPPAAAPARHEPGETHASTCPPDRRPRQGPTPNASTIASCESSWRENGKAAKSKTLAYFYLPRRTAERCRRCGCGGELSQEVRGWIVTISDDP